jgi:hypothetical protein
MKSSNLKMISLILLATCALFIGNAIAGSKNAQNKAVKLQQAYLWYDGQHERQIWLNPGLVAEFHASKSDVSKSTVKSVYADAVKVPKRYGTVRLWRLGGGVSAETAVRTLAAKNQTGKYSPVLHDGPTTSGRMRALPGNVILYLNPEWDIATVNAWVNQHQLEIVKKMDIGPNIYVIKTGPGLEALNIANSLYKSGEVVAAFPDWWEEVTTR